MSVLSKALDWFIARGDEPSTYAGLAGLLAALHIADAASVAHIVTAACMALAGFLAVVKSEGKL